MSDRPLAFAEPAPNWQPMDTQMRDIPADQSLIEYPCRFPIKVMGDNVDGFVHAVTEIARRFDPDFDAASSRAAAEQRRASTSA